MLTWGKKEATQGDTQENGGENGKNEDEEKQTEREAFDGHLVDFNLIFRSPKVGTLDKSVSAVIVDAGSK